MANFHIPIETANQDASLRIDGYHAALSYIPAIEEIIKKFDGKVYNCRFDKAVREATSNKVICDTKYESLYIYTWIPNRYSQQITIVHISFDEFTDGKRIPAEKIIANMKKYRDENLKSIDQIEKAMAQIPHMKKHIQRSIDKLNNYLQDIPFEVRDIYGIPYAVRFY